MTVSTKVQGLVRAAIADRETYEAFTAPNLPADVAEQVATLLAEYEAEQAAILERERDKMVAEFSAKLREHGSPVFDLPIGEQVAAIDAAYAAVEEMALQWSTVLERTDSERWSGYGLGRFGASIRTKYGKVKVTLTV